MFTMVRWYWHSVTGNGSPNTLPRVKLLNLDHVAIVVRDLEATIEGYRDRYRVEPLYLTALVDDGIEEAMIPVGGSFVKLMQPISDETPLALFLSNNGEGLHHVAYAVASIEAALEHLAVTGARLIDEVPRPDPRGGRRAFVHPGDLGGTLIELVELSDD